MKSKTLRILIVSVCGVVLIAEAILLAAVLGRKNPVQAKGGSSSFYRVERTIKCTTSDGTRMYYYDCYGRIREIISDGMIEFTLPVLSSDFGTSHIIYFYDDEGRLIRIHHAVNDSEWDDGEDACRGVVWVTDSHGGVINAFTADAFEGTPRAYTSGFFGGLDLYGMNLEEATAGSFGKAEYTYDEAGRIIKRIYRDGDSRERHSYFQYDPAGNPVRRTDAFPSGEVIRICRFEYDDYGRLTNAKVTVKGFTKQEYSIEYDSFGNVTRMASQGDESYERYEILSTFDADGRLKETVHIEADGTKETVEVRDYGTFLVKEEYLTEQEKKELGLTYDPDLIAEEKRLINPYYWHFTDDFGIIY